jgi:hypothetical protein
MGPLADWRADSVKKRRSTLNHGEPSERFCGLAVGNVLWEVLPVNLMDEARDFEDEESLGHLRNQVYAIINDAERAACGKGAK